MAKGKRTDQSRAAGATKKRKVSSKDKVFLLIGTRKGAFIYRGDAKRETWKLSRPHFLGSIVHHVVLDPRDSRTLLMAARTGHLGPTVFASRDWGKTWKEASKPPAFPKAENGDGRAVQAVFWLTPGHLSQPGVWFAGTTPHGLFRSDDGGDTWESVSGFNDHPRFADWTGGGTPDGPITHSILVDPRDAEHLYLGLSVGGIFESTNGGRDWHPLNRGVDADFLPDEDPEYGHDPHCMVMHPEHPDRLYHQNHCGIYRIDRPDERWKRIGRNMPRSVGDIGFPICVHPRDPDTVWVFPMDGTSVWPRTSPDGRPAVYASYNAGKSWKRLDKGLPAKNAWFTVKRQAMANDWLDPVGLYFGTTSGEVWMSRNEGKRWHPIAVHLPHIYSVEVGRG
jgi:photosystem II stability/assembly factor-like uncharacterized protein